MAASVLALIPAVLFFVFIQRHLTQELTAGGGEGVTMRGSSVKERRRSRGATGSRFANPALGL